MTAGITGAYEPNWYTATMVAADERRALASDLDVDVCVIGAGLAGLTIAYELSRAGWSVAVLEAGRVGWNASGRNLGIVAPGFGISVERIATRIGRDDAVTLSALSVAGVERVRKILADTGMPGVERRDGLLVVRAAGAARAESVRPSAREEFSVPSELWPAARVGTVLSRPASQEGLHFPDAFHIHPLNYAHGLAHAIDRAGGRIFEHTRALTIDGDGVRKRVQTAGGRVRAAQIVLATGNGGRNLYPQLEGTTAPLVRPMAITAPFGEPVAEAIRFGGIVEHAATSVRYHVVGDQLVWAGPPTIARTTGFGMAWRLRRQIRRLYPQVGMPALAQVWLAPVPRTVHGMPQIGQLAPGLWLAAGFADQGVNVTAMAADLIAEGIRHGDDRSRLFAPYGLVWAGGLAGRTVVAIALKGMAVGAWFRRHLPRELPTITPVAEPALVAEAVEQPVLALPAIEQPSMSVALALLAPTTADVIDVEGVVEVMSPASAPIAIDEPPIEIAAQPESASTSEPEPVSGPEPDVASEPAPEPLAVTPLPPAHVMSTVAASAPEQEAPPVVAKKKRRSAKAKQAVAPADGEATKIRKIVARGKRKSPVEKIASETVAQRRKRSTDLGRRRTRRDIGPPTLTPPAIEPPLDPKPN